jgi:SOS-response transcriptional repressor LexA
MHWKELIADILHKLRLSPTELSQITGISQPVITRWLQGYITKPQAATLLRLEDKLNIHIDDRDLNKMSWRLRTSSEIIIQTAYRSALLYSASSPINADKFNTTNQVREQQIPILADIPAGIDTINPRDDNTIITFDSRRQFALVVNENNGTSMLPFIAPGDIVICDTAAVPKNGDIVAARFTIDGTEFAALKLYQQINSESIGLYSYNQSVAPLILPRSNTVLHKVIFVQKA